MKKAVEQCKGKLQEFGCYFPYENGYGLRVFSGSLYGFERHYSPLANAYKKLGPGFSRKGLQIFQTGENVSVERPQKPSFDSTVFHFV